MGKSTWFVEAGFDLDDVQKSEIHHYTFTGTQPELDKHILSQYRKKAEYVVVELAMNIDFSKEL